MVKKREYRIPLPYNFETFYKGQIYCVAKSSHLESCSEADSGIELVKNEKVQNEKYGEGDYTEKIYYLGSRVPRWVVAIAPENSLKLYEKSWNIFPYCKTVVTHPLMGEKFTFTIESIHNKETFHLSNDSDHHIGININKENIWNLDKSEWKNVEIEIIDIGERIEEKYYKEEEDCQKFKSDTLQIGPLFKNWYKSMEFVKNLPLEKQEIDGLVAYKLVTVEFKYWGLQNKVENLLIDAEGMIFKRFYRQFFIWTDEWINLTIDEIRKYEKSFEQEMNNVVKEKIAEKQSP